MGKKNAKTVKGPQPFHGPKQMPTHTILLTSLGKNIWAAAQKRTGQNASTIVEQLIRVHGGQVQRDDFIVRDDAARGEETAA